MKRVQFTIGVDEVEEWIISAAKVIQKEYKCTFNEAVTSVIATVMKGIQAKNGDKNA